MDDTRLVLGPLDGEAVHFRALGARFMIPALATGGRFSMVEHPIDPRSLAAPMHTHSREDEYSFVLEGEIGMQVGETVITAKPGDLVFKPRGKPHAFWNATDRTVRMLEIISPAGFEEYFAEIALLLNVEGEPDGEALVALRAKYGLDMDLGSAPTLVERYGLTG